MSNTLSEKEAYFGQEYHIEICQPNFLTAGLKEIIAIAVAADL